MKVVVTLLGLAAIVWVLWYFLAAPSSTTSRPIPPS
jgi:hypothetical protein